MSFFTKLKDKFTKKTGDEVTTKYEKGLEKTRNEFVSKLNLLGIKYTKVSEEYFDELEKILISADIGINTVFKFMDRIKEEYDDYSGRILKWQGHYSETSFWDSKAENSFGPL